MDAAGENDRRASGFMPKAVAMVELGLRVALRALEADNAGRSRFNEERVCQCPKVSRTSPTNLTDEIRQDRTASAAYQRLVGFTLRELQRDLDNLIDETPPQATVSSINMIVDLSAAAGAAEDAAQLLPVQGNRLIEAAVDRAGRLGARERWAFTPNICPGWSSTWTSTTVPRCGPSSDVLPLVQKSSWSCFPQTVRARGLSVSIDSVRTYLIGRDSVGPGHRLREAARRRDPLASW